MTMQNQNATMLDALCGSSVRVSILDRLSSVDLCTFNSPEYAVFPGFCDVHVHFREPGFSYKETIFSGSLAAAHGGYTAVCTMPNLDPVPDTKAHLKEQLDLIKQDGLIHIYPYGSITMSSKGEALSEMKAMAQQVIGFTDDGKGVQRDDMMRAAMKQAKQLNKLIVAHCEVNDLLNGGYIHDGDYARENHHRGICSESEWKQVERDLALVRETGCAYHVCHISTKESVELIRKAKAQGLNVTCETAPHYLLMDDSYLQEDGRYKMNPPLRDRSDREALIAGIQDGTIDMIATDHAPHSEEEKSKGLDGSSFGIVGLETAFPLLYTYLVKENIISLEKLLQLLVTNPRKRFRIPMTTDFSIWDMRQSYLIDPEEFQSQGKSTPFAGWKVWGKCMATVCDGKLVWLEKVRNSK
ncbi:MAG: dihydroorotase [Ruminococcaceae bacterium]|nr:dihydroorotase [Oscillospiraceae bacterium]